METRGRRVGERRRRGGAEAAQAGRRRTPRIHVPVDPDAAPPSAEVTQEAVAEAGDGDGAVRGELDALEAPASEAGGADGEAPPVVKKKTRRGSRGGRNRRKKPIGGRRRSARPRPSRTAASRRPSPTSRPRKSRWRPPPDERRDDAPAAVEPRAEPPSRERTAARRGGAGLRADVRVARRLRSPVESRSATLLRLAGACPHVPRQEHPHELRDHLPRRQAVSRQRRPAAARRPPRRSRRGRRSRRTCCSSAATALRRSRRRT